MLQVTLLLFFVLPTILSAAPVKPGPRDRCPVCGMFVSKYPNWIAQIEFKDGSREFFDGPKDMFRYYLKRPEDKSVQAEAFRILSSNVNYILPVEEGENGKVIFCTSVQHNPLLQVVCRKPP